MSARVIVLTCRWSNVAEIASGRTVAGSARAGFAGQQICIFGAGAHLRDAMADAKRTRDRNGASEFGPGFSRDRSDVAPLVDRSHRRAAEAVRVPIPVTSGRPHPGRDRPHLADEHAKAGG